MNFIVCTIILIFIFISNNALATNINSLLNNSSESSKKMNYASPFMESWIDSKEEAEICVSTKKCDVIFDDIDKQPILWIGKSYFDPMPPENIAYDGAYSPKKMIGYIGENWKSYSFPGYDEHQMTPYGTDWKWTEKFDRKFVATDSDDGGVFKPTGKVHKVEDIAPYRHTVKIAHALQYFLSGRIEALIDLKDALVEGASGNYLTIMKPSNYWYKYEESFDYPGFAPALQDVYRIILPLVEAHIVLQRNKIYSEQEFSLVHKWLQKRVWGIEQGVMDGTITQRWGWGPHQAPLDHEMVKKRLLYLLWGVADSNDEYFTAGVNGFKDGYLRIIRNDGSLKSEHRTKSGNNFGLSTGNYVIQTLVNMAIILHHQGWDIRKDYPKVEKMVQFTSKLEANPRASKYFKNNTNAGNNFNNQLNFLGDQAGYDNTLAYVLIWDKIFNTEYSKNFSLSDESNAQVEMGIVDAREIFIGKNHMHSFNYKYEDSYPWLPKKSNNPNWSWFAGEKFQQ